MSYPTLTEVKSFLGVTTSDDDARLTLLISWTTELIHAYLGRNLLTATYTQNFYKPRTEGILLDNYPVDSITSITLDSSPASLTDYDLESTIGSVYGDFTDCDEAVIVYVGGYATLPPLIVDCFYAIVQDRYEEYKGMNSSDIKDVTLFDFAKVTYDTSTSSNRSLTYTGVNNSGNIPSALQDYLGVLDMYKSNASLLNADGVG